MTAPVALEKALRQLDQICSEKGGLGINKFRIDMRRFEGGWWVEFVYIPEGPDLWYAVRVLDEEPAK